MRGLRGVPSGRLRINAPPPAVDLVLAPMVGPFLQAHPQIELEIVGQSGFIDIVDAGYDAGVRYGEHLEQDMIAIALGPAQRYALAAAPDYLARHGRPKHPRDLLNHACLRGRFASGTMPPWEFEQDGEVIRVEPSGPLLVQIGGTADLAVDVAIAGTGIVFLLEDWLRPYFASGALEPIPEPWWQSFPGPFILTPGSLRPELSMPTTDPNDQFHPIDPIPLRLRGQPSRVRHLRPRAVRMPRIGRITRIGPGQLRHGCRNEP